MRIAQLIFWYMLAIGMVYGSVLMQNKNAPRLDIQIISACMVLAACCCAVIGWYEYATTRRSV